MFAGFVMTPHPIELASNLKKSGKMLRVASNLSRWQSGTFIACYRAKITENQKTTVHKSGF